MLSLQELVQYLQNLYLLLRMSVLRGLVTEGSSLLLMRLIALRRKMPENMTFVSLDPGLHIINTSFVSLYACVRHPGPSVTCLSTEL